jgi:hypothetical protein
MISDALGRIRDPARRVGSLLAEEATMHLGRPIWCTAALLLGCNGGQLALGDNGPADGSAGPPATGGSGIGAGGTGASTASGGVAGTGGAVVDCPNAFTQCGPSCVDLATDHANCGACGHACSASQGYSACVNGQCSLVCNSGYADCDALAADGCEIQVTSDPMNCGACGNVCAAGQECVSGVCSCVGSLTLCGSACVDTARDPTNCGACGVACAAGSSCVAGTCATCSNARIDASAAAALYTEYAFRVQPSLNPLVTFTAEEKNVAGLWEGLQAQLFNGKGYSSDQTLWRECYFLYRDCQITVAADDCSFGVLTSGVVANGAFYYSWNQGSGIFYSNLGKLVPNGTSLVKTVSAAYNNSTMSPPGLVLGVSGLNLAVYRAASLAFNVWSNAELIGTLADLGDRLAILDSSSQEIPETLP